MPQKINKTIPILFDKIFLPIIEELIFLALVKISSSEVPQLIKFLRLN
jgi:hypothetical protein